LTSTAHSWRQEVCDVQAAVKHDASAGRQSGRQVPESRFTEIRSPHRVNRCHLEKAWTAGLGGTPAFQHRPGTACLDGAPSSRVWLRLCERFGCGHVFGLLARETNVPLALMLVRMALRPISKTRS